MDFYNLSRVYCCSKKRIVNKKKDLIIGRKLEASVSLVFPTAREREINHLIPILPASSIFSSEYRTEQIKESDSDS